jgi:hypothetical protein
MPPPTPARNNSDANVVYRIVEHPLDEQKYPKDASASLRRIRRESRWRDAEGT